MLDPWIIEEIRRREDDRKHDREQSRVELPLEPPQWNESDSASPPAKEKDKRGVVVIDL